mmetsp:Transcript_2487/g.5709  ORF Transcript_2487/g.5709 Transcript_2487/m.5709 type:complete len:439 (-) Transcript_2487:407-1723(-)
MDVVANECVQIVDTTLLLRSRRADLEAKSLVVETVVKDNKGANSKILKTVANTLRNVRKETTYRALVYNSTRDTSGYQGEIKGILKALANECVAGVVAAVLLEAEAILEVVLTGGLLSTSKKRAHHHSASTEGKGLDCTTTVSNTTISNNRDPVLAGNAGNVKDSRHLRATNSLNELPSSNGGNTHTHADSINASLDELLHLGGRNNVSADNFEFGKVSLGELDELNLTGDVRVAGLQGHNINSSLDEGGEAGLSLLKVVNTDSGTNQETVVLVLGGIREVAVLQQILARDKGDKVSLAIEDRDLTALALAEFLVSLFQGARLRESVEVAARSHDGRELKAAVLNEINITGGDHTKELALGVTVLSDRNSSKALFCGHAVDVGNGVGRCKAEGRGDESTLVALDEADLLSLLLNSVAAVDDTNTTVESHVDGHEVLSD